jgi:hypothetical protein
MTKTVAIPQQNNLNLVIPNQYIGKRIEIIMYALDEIIEEKPIKKTMADFWGTLSDKTATEINNQVTESRNGWEERLNKQF